MLTEKAGAAADANITADAAGAVQTESRAVAGPALFAQANL